ALVVRPARGAAARHAGRKARLGAGRGARAVRARAQGAPARRGLAHGRPAARAARAALRRRRPQLRGRPGRLRALGRVRPSGRAPALPRRGRHRPLRERLPRRRAPCRRGGAAVGAAAGCGLDRALREARLVRLVAVVLNWNGGEDTPRALASLAGIETICVDNRSTDGSDAEVERRFPEVELIRNGANLGFAGGSNVGIRRALERGADWVLLLNDDAVAEPGVSEALEGAAAARPDAGVLACKVLFEDGATVMYAGASFNATLGYSGRRTGFGRPDSFHARRDVERADGAAMAVSRTALDRVGLFDERL